MSTATNNGSQKVFFNYKKALTGANMNEAAQVIHRPGVLSGMQVTIVDTDTVAIATGVFNISDGTHTVTIAKEASHNLDVDGTSLYIVARYTYSTQEGWYAAFLNVATVQTNDVLLAAVTYDTGDLDTVDLSGKTDGNRVLDSEVFITAGGRNQYFKDLIQAGVFGPDAALNNWTDKIADSWFVDSVNPPIEEFIGPLPVFTFDETASRYFYFVIKTGSEIAVNFKICYTGSAASTNGFVLKLDYQLLTDGLTGLDSLTFSTNSSQQISGPSAVNEYKEIQTSTLNLPSSIMTATNKLILCRISRDYGNVNDTYTGNISLIQLIPVAGS